ncbi:hypothetical protein ACE1CI_09035 [Aerosakkonemataceae cyanobacterium BLCC-F50]|uniref:Uncharacterized protein n=1 Tax=Floridaenema flaviceps BLCC-F50 TaxID=3153642 RepID=A0ABV4XP60_9CYAN
MADGDIVHSRLRRCYQKPYERLCGGKASIDECVHVLMQAIRRDIVHKGNLPVKLAQIMGEILDRCISTTGENNSVNWAALNVQFDRLVQQFDGQHYLKELSLRASKSLINELRYERVDEVDNASVEIFKRYINEVYESEFKERIPLNPEDNAGIDEATLKKRMEEMEPYINQEINLLAEKAMRNMSVENLGQQPRRKIKSLEEDEDLMAEHNHNNRIKIGKLLSEESIKPLQITTQDWKQCLSSRKQ